jgi:hypothetical protein
MASKSKEKELIPADNTPQWHVVTVETETRGTYLHRLLYGTKRQALGRTPADLRRFRELADFCNKRGLAPRPKVLCKADESLPVPKHKAITDDTYTAAP